MKREEFLREISKEVKRSITRLALKKCHFCEAPAKMMGRRRIGFVLDINGFVQTGGNDVFETYEPIKSKIFVCQTCMQRVLAKG